MKRWVNLFLVFFLAPSPCYCQAMAEFGSSHALPAGMGAGLAASYTNHGKMIKRSYQSILNAQQAAVAQTKAIEQYMKYGSQLQSQKKLADAELAFKYVLQVIARRDGAGSPKSVPALEHLVSVSKAQNKLNEAIKFQQTVLAFKKAEKTIDPIEVVKAQSNLSDLLVQNNDFRGAASVLNQSVSYYESHPSLPVTNKHTTLRSYAQVLRKLHRDEEAEAVEATDANELKNSENVATGKPSDLPKQAEIVKRQESTKQKDLNTEQQNELIKAKGGAEGATVEPPSVELMPVSVEQSKTEQR